MGDTATSRRASETAATWEASTRHIVVSADSHCGPSVREQLRPYCERKHLQAFDEFNAEMDKFSRFTAVPKLSRTYEDMRAANAQAPGLQDPHARLRDMDEEGIAANIVYHGGLNGQAIPFAALPSGLAWASKKYSDLEAVGIRIYNRWLADFVSVAPARQIGVAHIPITDLEHSVREVEFAASIGLSAVNLPAPRREFRHYNDPSWDRLWGACQDLDLVMNTHAGAGETDDWDGPAGTTLFALEVHYLARRTIWHLICGGVFERFPRLKYVATEAFADWVPAMLQDLDSAYIGMPQADDLREVLTRRPSEYWFENCFIGASFMSRAEAILGVEHGLFDNILWGADYPHLEGTWPRTRNSQRFAFSSIPPHIAARYLGENAIDVYGLDRRELRAVADRIGPTVEEIATPYEPGPDMYRGWAFRENGRYS